jgi:CheY-like chemotaxis protein
VNGLPAALEGIKVEGRRSQRVDEPLTVLFIEDDPAVADLYRLKLELDLYSVKTVPATGPVLEAAGQVRPDLIYLDVRRPDSPVLSLLPKLRTNPATRKSPVIVLWNGDPETARVDLELDGASYLVRVDSELTPLTRRSESGLAVPQATKGFS